MPPGQQTSVDMRKLLIAISAVALALPSWSMEFKLVGSTLVMSGPVVGDDLAHLKDQLTTKQVKLVLLHQSPGSDLWNGLRLAERIHDNALPTAVSGKFESAYGLIFLGGIERSFIDGHARGQTMLGLHGAHNVKTKQAMPEMGAQMGYFIRTMTADKFPRNLLDRTVYPKGYRDIIYVFNTRRFLDQSMPRGVMEYLLQPDEKHKCKMIETLDALSIGVITNPEIISLDIEVKDYLSEL